MTETTTFDPCHLGHCYINGVCLCGAQLLDYTPLTNLAVQAMPLRGEPRELTDGEMASRELIGTLRGSLGRAQERIRNLECAMLDALDNLRSDEPAAKRLRLELHDSEEAA